MAGVLASVFAPSSRTDDRPPSADDTLLSPLKTLLDTVRERIRSDGASNGRAGESRSPSAVCLDEFPERDRPLSHLARDRPAINPTDVVGIETEDGLRLSIPENPDAEIVSDVWVTIER